MLVSQSDADGALFCFDGQTGVETPYAWRPKALQPP
jgi:hypothetical protein